MIKKLRDKLCKLLFKHTLETYLNVDKEWYYDGENDAYNDIVKYFNIKESEVQ